MGCGEEGDRQRDVCGSIRKADGEGIRGLNVGAIKPRGKIEKRNQILPRQLRHCFEPLRHERRARPRGRAGRVARRDGGYEVEHHIGILARAETKRYIQTAVFAVRGADDRVGSERLGVEKLALERAQRILGFVGRAAGFEIYTASRHVSCDLSPPKNTKADATYWRGRRHSSKD